MRKLRLACDDPTVHYAAAACAITEVGMTKGFRHKDRMVRSVAYQGDGRRVTAATYEAAFVSDPEAVRVQTEIGSSKMVFHFTWPGLRMYSMYVKPQSRK